MDDATTRARLVGEQERLTALRRDLDAAAGGGDGRDGAAPLHAADVASDVLEREVDRSVRHQVDEDLRDVEEALRRLEDGTYGTCETCGEALPAERLAAVPATRFCTRHEGLWEGDRLDLTLPAGRYEDGDAHTTDRAAAREAGRHLELVGDDADLDEPVELGPEERALHLADPARPDPGALSAVEVAVIEERRAAWDHDERRQDDRLGADDEHGDEDQEVEGEEER